MLKLHQVTETPEWWRRLDKFADRLTFHTQAWIRFLADTQHATPIFAEVRDGSSVVGCFHSLIIRPFGCKVLASPFPGWGTDYMGFNLHPGVPRWLALQALEQFAFQELGCMYFEVADRLFTIDDGRRLGFEQRTSITYETDLNRPELELFNALKRDCRTAIRKAQRCGVMVEEAAPNEEFIQDYYTQLTDVFLKQNLLPTYSLQKVRTFLQYLFPTGNIALFRARNEEGKCVATAICHGLDKFALLWGTASLRKYLHLRPNEAMHWRALQHWKSRGAEFFDWGGAGDYKAKYASRKVEVVRFSKSRVPLLSTLRNQAQKVYLHQHRWRSWWNIHQPRISFTERGKSV